MTLLHNKNVVSAILSHIDNTPPTVSYRYTSTIANNHKKVVSDIDFTIGSCIDSVVTGNLRIIENRRIRKR